MLNEKWSKEEDVVLVDADGGDSSTNDMSKGLFAMVLYDCGKAYWP